MLQLRNSVRLGLMALFIVGSAFLLAQREGMTDASENSKAGRGQKVILEVMNYHFTVGKKIPSVYLRVFSDGTAECHTEKYTGLETDVVKTRILAVEEFGKLEALINQPEMLDVKKRYELMHFVVDSWMEWDIKLPRAKGTQMIEVASFSPASARKKNQPYPDSLVALGCSILKMRLDVFGDQNARIAECPINAPDK